MLKKLSLIITLVAVMAVTCGANLPTAMANTPIRLTLNGNPITTDVAPVIQNGRTLVPFRVIFEALGAKVEWDEKTNTVAGYLGPMFVLLQPGSTRAWITGKEVKLDVGPVITGGRTMVPLRFVAESMGAKVEWIEATRTVAITHTLDPVRTPQKSGDFTTVYSGELTTLNYLVTATSAEQAVAANTVDGLVEYDHLGVLHPSLAKSWKISNDGLVYTFNLRQGVNWMTWDGKVYAEVTAQDFVDALKYVLTKENASKTANIAYVIKGAQEYFEGKTTDFYTVGVKAIDKYTVEYTLKSPQPYFMTMLTYVTFLPVNGKFLAEQGSKFATDHRSYLSNGAYILRNHEPQNIREFVKNPQYWDANNVHINKLTYRFNREASQLAPEMFFRGEITAASIPVSILDGWMQDPVRKEMVRPAATSTFTFWYAFNFDPKFSAEYQPENWKKAVNNINFRKAMFHGLDRVAAMLTFDPYNPERQIRNTITPSGFVSVGGLDYTMLPPLAKHNKETYNRSLALEFRNKAQVELRNQGVTFPIKVMMPYNTGSADWTNRVQVIEQQLENLLGKGFIDIIPVGFPPTGFLDATRRALNFAIQEVNWGPDYADPATYTDPFLSENVYKYAPLGAAADWDGTYDKLIAQAKAEVLDTKKRYELFAQAEAYLLEMAYVIPYRCGGGGYVASRLHPFTSAYAPFGVSNLKFKYQIVLDKPMNMKQFAEAEAQWQKDREAALKRWGQ